MTPRLLLALTLAGLFAGSLRAGQPLAHAVLNEQRTLQFTLVLENQRLAYEVAALAPDGRATPVVERSPLGLTRRDSAFNDGLRFVRAEAVRTVAESYTLLAGKRREVSFRAVEQTFLFENASAQPLSVTVRAEADGVAFRYGFPSGPAGDLWVTDEATGFKLPADGRAWMQPYEKIATWSPAYESEYANGVPVGTPQTGANWSGWALPMLFNVRKHWVLVTEAGEAGTCFGVHLQANPEGGLYRVRLPEADETYGVATQEAKIRAPWQSPWRVVVVGATPGAAMETMMVYNLNPPCEIADTSWIKPGRVSWSWWSDKGSPSDYNRLVPFIDLSADFGWEYSLIDLGWERMYNGTIAELLAYAKKKKVGLILWYNSGGRHNQVMDGLRDKMHDPAARAEEMAKLQQWGVKGIKVDFMQSDKQYVLQLYIDILRDAAKHHLFVDFHGATIPRGWARTFPNLLTSEGVRGAEQYWDPQFADRAHTLHTIYTFTRNALGSMDYTPVIFGAAPELQWHKTTNAHELALAVAFESGLQHFVDGVAAYRCQPDHVQQFLKDVPVAWDETRFLAGEPGRLSVLARRKGAAWYLAALNGLDDAQKVTVPLGFLGTGRFAAKVVADGASQKETKLVEKKVGPADTLELELAGRGGSAAQFTPVP